MDVNAWIRLIAGALVLVSVALGYWISPLWFLFTAFVGGNLVQSAFSGTCPMMFFLRKCGVRG